MAYLNLDPGYFTHLKTMRLVARLGRGAEAMPIRLWAHCALHHPKDGIMLGYKQAELEAMLQALPSEIEAMIDCGFLERLEGDKGFACHDWLDHQGHLAAFKERAERGAKARWDKARMLKGKPSNAKHDSKQCLEQCPVPTIPSLPTVPPLHEATTAARNFRADFLSLYPESPNTRYSPQAERDWFALTDKQVEQCRAAIQIYAAEVALWPKPERKYVFKPENFINGYGPEFKVSAETFKRQGENGAVYESEMETYNEPDKYGLAVTKRRYWRIENGKRTACFETRQAAQGL